MQRRSDEGDKLRGFVSAPRRGGEILQVSRGKWRTRTLFFPRLLGRVYGRGVEMRLSLAGLSSARILIRYLEDLLCKKDAGG